MTVSAKALGQKESCDVTFQEEQVVEGREWRRITEEADREGLAGHGEALAPIPSEKERLAWRGGMV